MPFENLDNLHDIGIFIAANLITFILAYLFGSINYAIILTRIFADGKVQQKGSNNAGATNTTRNYGKKIGTAVFTLDTLKGYLMGVAFYFLNKYVPFFKDRVMVEISIIFVIVGHIWPIFFRFKGGKGSSSFIGIFLFIDFIFLPIGFVIYYSILHMRKMVSFSSVISPYIMTLLVLIPWFTDYPTNPFAFFATGGDYYYIASIALFFASILVTIAHIPNIQRMLAGNERKIKYKPKNSTEK